MAFRGTNLIVGGVVRQWFYARDMMRLRLRVRDPQSGDRYRFLTDSLDSYMRAWTFFTKEEGTIAWIRDTLRPDDVLLDIGANVGLYSIFAGRRISSAGHVYACEPHLPTAAKLIENITTNGVADRVSVLSAAIAPSEGFAPFRYKRWRSGASGSQLEVAGAPTMEKSVGTELKLGISVDDLVKRGAIRAPNLIKIDTDGIELQILHGMKELMAGPLRPRSIQVEIQRGETDQVLSFMRECGYAAESRHFGCGGQAKIDKGVPLDDVIYNVIFVPEEVARQPRRAVA